MKLRIMLRFSLVAFTVAAAGASAMLANIWIAGGMAVCAAVIAIAPIAMTASRDDIERLLELLRVSQQAGAPAVKAVTTSVIIFIGKSTISSQPGSGYALIFRDEIDVPVWREMATLLRHQAHPPPELRKVGQSAALGLGKSSDL